MMMTTLILANAFTDSLEHIVGFLSVLVTLTILWLITASMGRYFAGADKRSSARTVKAAEAAAEAKISTAPTAAASSDEKSVSDEMIAAISAAAYVLLGGRHRIVSIRSASTDWSREGRRQHFASHKIR